MREKVTYRLSSFLAAMFAIAFAFSCSIPDDHMIIPARYDNRPQTERQAKEDTRSVFILYSLGFNNLSGALKDDINDVFEGTLPSHFRGDDAILVFSHNTKGSYSTPNPPVLTRLYRNQFGHADMDTLIVYPDETISSSAETLNKVLTYIKEEFPAQNYGMLMSSHGTGWVPAGYTSDPDRYEGGATDEDDWIWNRPARRPLPYHEKPQTDGMPMVKSFGVQNNPDGTAYEINITELADAIPMHMEYIIFDACFMGGIEVAYELRDRCRYLCFSQTEILSDGMGYTDITDYLFAEDGPDLTGFSESYYSHYDGLSGPYRSATISLVDCTALEPLAEVCREIFQENRTGIASIEGSSMVQQYFRDSYRSIHKWFYDLQSICRNCGASEEHLSRLEEALEDCIKYKAATESFMNSISITEHCGLSMYLPYKNRDYLNAFYKELEWNKATSLVE
ncbi:MAG: hypothetical protein E7117_09290 [Bacteroidales bacterium]|nr:hypothetical protein [Bacteroidales bacterium]